VSNNPRGILAYGYNLGGPELWRFKVVGGKTITNIDTNIALEILLREIVGFNPTVEIENKDNYYQRLDEAKAKLGIDFVCFGSWEYPGYIIATMIHKADDWGTKEIGIAFDHSANDRLERALKILGIIPDQTEPKWILTSFYG
jgi:hypothetical protein